MKRFNPLKITKNLAAFLDEKQAEDIVILDVQEKSDLADYFVLATGNSYIHVNSLSNYSKACMLDNNVKPLRREGVTKETRWSVSDYGFIILHIMTKELRLQYDLENVWQGAKRIDWKEK